MTTDTALIATNSKGATALPSYADAPRWRRYQEFFPPRMRCTPGTTPVEEWWRWRDLEVHLDRLAVPSSPVKVIVLHGVGAYGRVMAPAAVIAHHHGYETLSPDLPGFGLTRVPWRQFVYQRWIDCVVDLIEAERARDRRPVVLFGVSLGGVLAYQAAARSRGVVGLIVTTLADLRQTEVRRSFARTPLLGSAGAWLLKRLRAVTDGLPLPMRLMTKMHNISNVPELAKLAAHDPLGGGNIVPARFLRTLLDTAPDLEPEKFDVCPVLLAHPGVDRMTEIAHSRRFFDRLAGEKRMVVLDGASHMPTEHPGVDQLECAVVDFMKDVVKRSRT
jgi:alpha-beta hydrolase superfamily lysophospholipase